MDLREIIRRYDVSGPRYTSYPTAPQWTEQCGEAVYLERLGLLSGRSIEDGAIEGREPAALYIHIPFCESLCLYCGCNIQLTRDHGKAVRYVDAVLLEMGRVVHAIGTRPRLSQIAWGGGTPTFLSVLELTTLFQGILSHFEILRDAEISIEIDPRVTSDDQLERLRELGFNRVSLGVQDFAPDVQKAVNRLQSAELTERMLRRCHELGYSGVNYDLIYGLPAQTQASFEQTVCDVIRHHPDRIALYNYAHLPSLRKHQSRLERFSLPDANLKTELFELAYRRLVCAGYRAVGMDHFALESDELFNAANDGRLYRNFQGYTVKRGLPLFGFGASAITELDGAYFQNVRELGEYHDRMARGRLATFRGTVLSSDDEKRKWVIQRLLCQFRVDGREYRHRYGKAFWTDFEFTRELKQLAADQLLEVDSDGLRVTETGRLFVRHAAMAFDAYLNKAATATYSRTL